MTVRVPVGPDEVPDWLEHHDDHDEGSAAAVWRLLATLPPRALYGRGPDAALPKGAAA